MGEQVFRVRQRAVIFNEDEEVLMLKYSSYSSQPGKWDFPGGHLEKKEGWKEGLSREIAEETNLNPRILSPFKVFSHKDTYITFFVCKTMDSQVRLSEEHTDYTWTTAKEVKQIDLVRKSIQDDILAAKDFLTTLY